MADQERTFVMIKPDAHGRRLSGEILSRFEKRGLRFAGMVVAALLAGCSQKQAAPPRPAAPVTVAMVGERDIPLDITAIGNVEPVQTVQIRSMVNGQVDEVLFKAHHGKVNRLLSRERLIRSAYLFYVRDALPQKPLVGVTAGVADDSDDEDEN